MLCGLVVAAKAEPHTLLLLVVAAMMPLSAEVASVVPLCNTDRCFVQGWDISPAACDVLLAFLVHTFVFVSDCLSCIVSSRARRP